MDILDAFLSSAANDGEEEEEDLEMEEITDSTTTTTSTNSRSKGASRSEKYKARAVRYIGMATSYLKLKARELAVRAPVTTLQMAVGLGLTTTGLLRVTPLSAFLFHPLLLVSLRRRPRNIFYNYFVRIPSSLLILSSSWLGLVRALGWLYLGQADLEAFFVKEYPADNDKESVIHIPNIDDITSSSSSSKKQKTPSIAKINHKFLQLLFLSGSVIVLQEIIFNTLFEGAVSTLSFSKASRRSISNPSFHLIYPYALYPILQHALTWTWALISSKDASKNSLLATFQSILNGNSLLTIIGGDYNIGGSSSAFGFRLEPIHVPFILLLMNGLDGGFLDSLKGLSVCLISAAILNLKRRKNEDLIGDKKVRAGGEKEIPLWKYLVKTLVKWKDLTVKLVKFVFK